MTHTHNNNNNNQWRCNMIGKAEFQSNIGARKTTVKETTKIALEKKIDTAIRLHTENIVMAAARGEPDPGLRIVVHIPGGRESDLRVFESLGGNLNELVRPYVDSGWNIERDGSVSPFYDKGPTLDICIV